MQVGPSVRAYKLMLYFINKNQIYGYLKLSFSIFTKN